MKYLVSIKISNYNDQVVCRLTSRKLRRIYSFFERDINKNCTFNVLVRYGNGYENEGKYRSKSEAIVALKQFLDW